MTQSPPAPAPEQPAGPPPTAEAEPARRHPAWNAALVTLLSLLTAMVVGALLVAVADEKTRGAMGYFFAYPPDTFSFGWHAVSSAYISLFEGAIVDPSSVRSSSSGWPKCSTS